MRAITICQPYAHLIALPETDPEMKRTENRTWPTRYRGELLIHAGKSREWLEVGDLRLYPGMVFGAFVALVDMVGCYPVDALPPEFSGHKHALGPWCHAYARVRVLPSPIPAMGAQGLWIPAPEFVEQVRRQFSERASK